MGGSTDAIIKQLIDSLTTTLSQLTVEIKGISKALDQADIERRDLSEKVSEFKDVPANLVKLLEKLDQVVQHKIDIQNIINELRTIKTNMEPVSKLSSLLYKPLSIVVLCVTLVATFFWLETNVRRFIDGWQNKKTLEFNQQYNQSTNNIH